jgi:hypothetical protein
MIEVSTQSHFSPLIAISSFEEIPSHPAITGQLAGLPA